MRTDLQVAGDAAEERVAEMLVGSGWTILGRQVPSAWIQRLHDAGVFRRLWQTDEVVRIADFIEDDEYLPRIAVAVPIAEVVRRRRVGGMPLSGGVVVGVRFFLHRDQLERRLRPRVRR